MSFDLNLVCLNDGSPDTFPVSIVRQALDPFIKSRDGTHCRLSFPDGGSGELFSPDDGKPQTKGVSISRASGADIYDALYEILRQTNSVLMWSFGGCVVADKSVIPDLPDGLIEILGAPTIVQSGAEILAAVGKT